MSITAEAKVPPEGWFGVRPDELDPEMRDSPHAAWNALREAAPVHRTPHGYYRIARHADVTLVLKDLPVGEQKFAGVTYDIYEFKTSPVPTCPRWG